MKSIKTGLFLLLLLLGCSDDENSVAVKSEYFSLSQLVQPTGGRVALTVEIFISDFDLGNLKASKEFYFLLGNQRENPVTDITLETDDPRFVMSPKNIALLKGVGETNDFIPLVSLGIIHGVQLNGVGFTDVLEMGEHVIKLKIKGKAVENGAQVNVESEFDLTVNAKVMDIELFDGGLAVDLLSPASSASGIVDAGGLGAVPGYEFQSNTVTIRNTGNVEISVDVRSFVTNASVTQLVILPGQEKAATLPQDLNNPDYSPALISIDGKGTIADYNRIKQGNDGRGYLIVQ